MKRGGHLVDVSPLEMNQKFPVPRLALEREPCSVADNGSRCV